jgi:hypothetical protein
MAKDYKKKSARTGRSKWIMAGLFVLGLALGAAAGFYIHYYLLNPAPKQKTAKERQAAAKQTDIDKSKRQEKKYSEPQPADPARAEQFMSYLSQQIGARPEGSEAERAAAAYLKSELESLGYAVSLQEFALPDGATSQNLIAADPGQSNPYTFLVSGHMDSRAGSPGANDDASGCAAVLELARVVKGTKHLTEIRFLLFGAEEDYGTKRSAKRIGSNFYVNNQPPEELAKIVGMVSADTIAVGPEAHFREWGLNSPTLAQSLVFAAQAKGLNAMQDPSENSDHEPFGQAGIPAVWMERMLPGGQSDTSIHTAGDNMAHVSPSLVSELVDLLRVYLLSLDEKYCKAAVTR